MADIGSAAELIMKIIDLLKPSDLEKIKDAIEKREAQIADEKQTLLDAISSGNIDLINRILFG